jgi:hypothetical protein
MSKVQQQKKRAKMIFEPLNQGDLDAGDPGPGSGQTGGAMLQPGSLL